MGSRKETEQLLTCIRKAGGTLRRSGSGHWKVYLDGRMITTIASSPSDGRSLRNVRAVLRREGMRV